MTDASNEEVRMTHALRLAVVFTVVLAAATIGSVPASAQVVNVPSAVFVSGSDSGPQDGIFDEFITPGFALVTNNGWSSLRGGLAFPLAGVPAGVTVSAATLTMSISNWEGERHIVVHGYGSDGVIQLPEFSRDALIGRSTVSAPVTIAFDVTGLVGDAVATGQPAIEVIVREEPANAPNYLIMSVDAAMLVIEYTLQQTRVVDIDVKPGGMPNSVNAASEGQVAVAVLASPEFDVNLVDLSSLTFGRTGAEASVVRCDPALEDVNADALADLVCHFSTRATGFLSTDTVGVLKGLTSSGMLIKGVDSVRIVR